MTTRADLTNHTLRLVNNFGAPTPHTSIRPNIRGRSLTDQHDAPTPPEPTHFGNRPVDKSDPRWAFAVLIASRLEGDRAAVLRPEARERLVCLGKKLGIRPFDAALTIAMVQDAARRGQAPGQTAASHSPLAHRLAAITKPTANPSKHAGFDPLSRFASAFFLATALLGLAIMWVQMGD